MTSENKVLKTQKLIPLKIKDFREIILNGNRVNNENTSMSSRKTNNNILNNENERILKFPEIGRFSTINSNRPETRSQDQSSKLYNQTFSSNMKSQLINFENNYSLSNNSRQSSKNINIIYNRIRRNRNTGLSEYFTQNTSKEDSITVLNGSWSTKSNKSIQRIMKFRDVVSTCKEEEYKTSKLKKEIKEKIKDFNQIIRESQDQSKDFNFLNYLKESKENLKPNFKIKTTFIYGNSGKPKIFSERLDHILDMSKKISLMDESAAYKFRDVITKKYGFKINKNLDFGSTNITDLKNIRDDKIADNHLKILKLTYKTQLLKKKAFLFKRNVNK